LGRWLSLGSARARVAGWCALADRRTSAARGCAGGLRARRRSPTRSTCARPERRRGTPSCSARGECRRGAGASLMRRIASIWLPALAIERWAKSADSAPDACPVVLTVEGPHGLLIHAVTEAAAERGARPGARLTDARALEPGLI